MQGRSRTRKIVYFRVNFKLFAEGSKTWRILSNDKKGTRCIVLRRFYWVMAKYLKSDSITESYVVTKIPLRQSISNLSKRAVVPRSFSQKDNGIWSPDHYSCLALGLVFQNQEKHFWRLVFSTCRSSMNFGNIPWSKGAWLNLCIFVVTSFLVQNQYLKKSLFWKLAQFFLWRGNHKFIKTCLKIMNYEVRKERLLRNIMLNCLRQTVKNTLTKFHLVSPNHLVL